MKKQLMKICAVALCTLPCGAWAQESAEKEGGVSFSVGADVVSSYVWRGAYQSGLAIQPSLGVEFAGLSLSSWGSVGVDASFKEVDFTLSYSIAGLDVTVTDYWWMGEGAYRYFSRGHSYDPNDPGKKVSEHLFEATLAYTLPLERFPAKLSWSTFFAGNDFKYNAADKPLRAFSTYIEASYPFVVKEISLEAALGLRPWESPSYQPVDVPSYYSHDFAAVNVSLKATKKLKITDSFTLPVFGQLIFNPNAEDVFLVCGIQL
ncbi:MAG: hypothetical protein LBK47_10255 [Prevotellaceae bacterium]|jgi:hypothetical protein|nr:hypothetical protein [Prevotellaceae bacterium]